jgi:hypothetical protein
MSRIAAIAVALVAATPTLCLSQVRPRTPRPAAAPGPSLTETTRWLVTEGAAIQRFRTTLVFDDPILGEADKTQEIAGSQHGRCNISFETTPSPDGYGDGITTIHLDWVDVLGLGIEQVTRKSTATLRPPIWKLRIPTVVRANAEGILRVGDRFSLGLLFPSRESADRVQHAIAHAARLCGAHSSPF